MKIKDRIVLSGILPKEGSFTTLIIIEDIKKKISITQKEIEKLSLISNENGISWDNEKDKDVKIEFTELEEKEIKKILEKLDKEEKLTNDHLGLYKLFVK